MKTAAVESPSIAAARHSFAGDLAELVKARLTLLVLLTTAVGFYLGAEPPIDYKALFQTVLGTAAAAAGASGVAAIGLFAFDDRAPAGGCHAGALKEVVAHARRRFDSVISPP